MRSAFPRILAVEDDPDMRSLLEYGLASYGFDVRAVADGRAAADVLDTWSPEAVLLDVGLPGIDGLSLIASLRRVTEVPILIITGRAAAGDKLFALERGADDYIAKPFDLKELAALIGARLRRPRLETREIVRYDGLAIDVGQRTATRDGKPLDLSSREFDLLLALARRPGQVFTRSQLLDLVWGADRDVTPSTVETYISYLRAKVDVRGAPRLIHTMRGVGYTLRTG